MKFPFPEDKIKTIGAFLSQPKKIVITTHHRPDGDAIGSSLALYNFLVLRGHQVTVVTPDDYPVFLNWLPGNDKVIAHEKNILISETKVKEAELIFCLDFNRLERLDKLG